MRTRLAALLLLLGLLGVGAPPARAAAPPPDPRFRFPSLFPPAPTAGPAAARIFVDLSEQQLVAFHGPTPVRAFAVSTGDPDHPTIVGRCSIQDKYPVIDLIGTDYYYHDVPHVMLFAKPFYIHAAPWRVEFGRPLSHGCVTLAPADAAWLFAWAEIGTQVEIWW